VYGKEEGLADLKAARGVYRPFDTAEELARSPEAHERPES
jgi:hypothetical protein